MAKITNTTERKGNIGSLNKRVITPDSIQMIVFIENRQAI